MDTRSGERWGNTKKYFDAFEMSSVPLPGNIGMVLERDIHENTPQHRPADDDVANIKLIKCVGTDPLSPTLPVTANYARTSALFPF